MAESLAAFHLPALRSLPSSSCRAHSARKSTIRRSSALALGAGGFIRSYRIGGDPFPRRAKRQALAFRSHDIERVKALARIAAPRLMSTQR